VIQNYSNLYTAQRDKKSGDSNECVVVSLIKNFDLASIGRLLLLVRSINFPPIIFSFSSSAQTKMILFYHLVYGISMRLRTY